MKKCPACAEEIQDEAKKCRYCSADLGEKFKFPQIGCGGAVILFVLIALACNSLFGKADDSTPSYATSATAPRAEYTSVPVSTVAEAQTTARDLINQAGHSCIHVTSLDPLGTTEDGGTAHRASCTNGDQFVILMTKDYRLRFLSSCAIFTATTGKRC